ncbi:MAG: fibrobacter succinogenes major paralogous domain-containing protein [Fibromonadaceae bacterium]|jgi:uncharacterized protein (TIGR02145 family)|nr:fibrobacter succinogenes major paralogous domain-containing protein [Fibromonadaceae bacterium]
MNRVKTTLFAAISIALTFTFSCSGDDGGSSSVAYGSLRDSRDGKTYKTIRIGSQTWMAENLNFEASGSACCDNISSNCDTYGRLYNWATALTVCPPGWHLPSDAEWDVLTNHVGSNAGTKLKASSGWNVGNGTDDFGFSALPGGYGISSGFFYNVGYYGDWWSATEVDASYAWFRYMYGNRSGVDRYFNDKENLFSVRCVKANLP